MQNNVPLRWAALAVLLLAYFLSVFHRVSIAIMANQLMNDLSLGPVQLGLLAAAYFYPYAFMQLPAGILADRLGPRRLVPAMLFLAALASAAFSLSESFPAMLASRILVGLSVSCVFVPSMKYVATFFPASMFSTLASLFFFSGMVGLLAASAPLAVVIELVGWRAGFLFIGIATALLSLAGWFSIAELPGRGQDQGGEDAVNRGRPYNNSTPGFIESLKLACLERGIWPIAIRNHLNYGSIMNFQSLWVGPYLISVVGVDRISAGSLIMFLSLGGLVAPFSGFLSDRVFRSRKIPAVITTYATVLFWIPFAFFTERLTPGIITALFLVNGVMSGLSQGAGQAQVKELYPVYLAGTAIGLGNFVTMAGPAVVPLIISAAMSAHTAGGVLTADTFAVCFRYSLAAAVIAAVAITFSKETFDASIYGKKKIAGG